LTVSANVTFRVHVGDGGVVVGGTGGAGSSTLRGGMGSDAVGGAFTLRGGTGSEAAGGASTLRGGEDLEGFNLTVSDDGEW